MYVLREEVVKVKLLSGGINLGDVGDKVDNSGRVTPLVIVPRDKPSRRKDTEMKVSFHSRCIVEEREWWRKGGEGREGGGLKTHLTKFPEREIPAAASKVEEAESPMKSAVRKVGKEGESVRGGGKEGGRKGEGGRRKERKVWSSSF